MLGFSLGLIAAAVTASPFCLVVTEDQGEGIAILSSTGAVERRVEIGHWPHELEIDRSGSTVFVSQFGITDYDSRLGAAGDHVSRIDLASGQETGRLALPDGRRAPHGVKLRPGTDELFVNTESGGDQMLVYDARSLQLIRQFGLPAGTHNFIFSPDGAALFSFAGAGGVTRSDPISG